jgi:hypothetical protein
MTKEKGLGRKPNRTTLGLNSKAAESAFGLCDSGLPEDFPGPAYYKDGGWDPCSYPTVGETPPKTEKRKGKKYPK